MVPLRLSGATRGPLALDSSSLGPYLGARRPQRCLKSKYCWTMRTLTKNVPACTEPTLRPLPWSTETGPKARYVKNTPKLDLARSRRALLVPRGASGVFHRAHQEADWAPETPQRSIVASWLCPSVLEPTLWMVSLRTARSALKLHSASQRVPRAGCNQGSPREIQEGQERVLGTPVAPRSPKTVQNRGL